MILRRIRLIGRGGRSRPSWPDGTSLERPYKRTSSATPGLRGILSLSAVSLLLLLTILSCGHQSTKPGKPVCEVSPDTLDFGRVEVGSTGQRTFRVTNTGTAGLQASIHLDCGGFQILNGSGDTTIAPGETLAVRVEYAPESRDEARCSVELGDVVCGSVELVGNGFRTWHIHPDGSGDAPTVQAGIDSSQDGDVVLVAPGTYYENINLRGRAIHLVSEAGPEVTILDGSREDSTVVMCESGEDNATIIEGFTITGGSGWTIPWSPTSKVGGGIECYYSAPVIRGNVIKANHTVNLQAGANSRGGGVSFATSSDSAPIVIEGNTIEENFCSRNSGGVDISGPCIIQDNVIRGNATGTGDGGGLYLIGDVGKVIIRRNLIVENHAMDHGGGIYIGTFTEVPGMTEIYDNVILHNVASGQDGGFDSSGGGMWLYRDAYVHHNTIAFNHAASSRGHLPGGGMVVQYCSSATRIEFNLIARNGEGGFVAEYRAACQLTHNLIFGNDVTDVDRDMTTSVDITNNLFLDPLFCDTTATSTGALAENSPALTDSLGVIGAVSTPGCGPKAPAMASPWGRVGRRERD